MMIAVLKSDFGLEYLPKIKTGDKNQIQLIICFTLKLKLKNKTNCVLY